MKNIALLVSIVLLGGCAVNKTWDEKGGDRKEGTVYYTTAYERGYPPKNDSISLWWMSNSKCTGWGYGGAEKAGEKETECLKRDEEDRCATYQETLTWHCDEADD